MPIMKKLILFLVLLAGVAEGIKAQIVVSGEMFSSNPSMFMGKVVVIKNPIFKSKVSQPAGTTPAVVGAVSPSSVSPASAPAGVPLGPKAASSCCNPRPNMELTKWEIAPGKFICVQVEQRFLPMLPPASQPCKEISFRVTPDMYVLTRCSVK